VWAVAIAVVAVHLATSHVYSYHRDEVYYLAAGKRLAWGYVDQPPLTPLLYRVSHALFGSSLLGLRVAPALLHGAIVLLTARLTREMGGDGAAQYVAAIAAALCPIMLTTGHFLGTVTPELVASAAISLVVVRIINGGTARLWVLAGAIAGIGLLDKWTVGFLLAGLAVGLAVTDRHLLRTPWLLLGIAIALALWAPNLAWQAAHGWPQFEVAHGLRNTTDALLTVPYQVAIVGAAFVILALPGLRWMAGDPAGTRYRAIAIAFAVVVVLVMASQGKPYYASVFAPVLLATGAVAVGDRVMALVPWIVGFGLATAPLAMPLLPLRTANVVRSINPEIGEMVGWPQLASLVTSAAHAHPGATILVANYSEAGAIELFAASHGATPQPISGHMNYWYWGHPHGRSRDTIAVGYSRTTLERWFASVEPVARFHSPAGINNMENGAPIFLCRGQRADWDTLWPQVKRR